MRLARFAWVIPALLALSIGSATGEERYRLNFRHDGLKRLALDSPLGHSTSFWYCTYRLTNVGRNPVTQPPLTIWATTDTPWDFRDGLAPLAYHQLNYVRGHRNCPDWCGDPQHYTAMGERKSQDDDWQPNRGKPMLTYRDLRADGFQISADETVDCVAIFSQHTGRDLRGLVSAMNLFTMRDHKGGLEMLRQTLKDHPEGDWNKWVRELLEAADGGLDEARRMCEELRGRWNKEKQPRSAIVTADGEVPDLDLLNDAVHLLRTREYESAIEKLNTVLTDHPESRFRRDADQLRTLAARRRVEEMDAWIERYLYGYQPERLKNEADTVKLHVAGLWDVVFPDGTNVFRETRILELSFVRPGDDLYPDQEGFRLVGSREYVEEGERVFIRKTHEDRGTK
jgi:hypothetical protein